MNKTIELVNLNSFLVSFKILIEPVISSSLDIFPFDINLSSSIWIKLLAISGMDHTIKLTDFKNGFLLSSFLLVIEPLELFIVPLFVIHEINILTMPLNQAKILESLIDWLSTEPFLVSLDIEIVKVDFFVSFWVVSSVSNVDETIKLRNSWHVESVLLELWVVVFPVVVVRILSLHISLVPVNRVLVNCSGLHDVLRGHSKLHGLRFADGSDKE